VHLPLREVCGSLEKAACPRAPARVEPLLASADWLNGVPDMSADPAVQGRKSELIEEANVLLGALRSLGGSPDPLTSPATSTQLPR